MCCGELVSLKIPFSLERLNFLRVSECDIVMSVVGLRGLRRKKRRLLPGYSTRGATVPSGTVHSSATAAARVVGALGTPAAGLCPWPAREKGFPSNLFLP